MWNYVLKIKGRKNEKIKNKKIGDLWRKIVVKNVKEGNRRNKIKNKWVINMERLLYCNKMDKG